VVGDHGAMEYSSAGREPKVVSGGWAEVPLVLPAIDGYQAEIEYFVECCRHQHTAGGMYTCVVSEAVRIAGLAEEARSKKGEAVSCKL